MNFEMSAEELAVVESAEQVAREVIQPLAQHYDETETFCLASIRALRMSISSICHASTRVTLQDVDLLAGHPSVAHEKARRRQACQAAADNVGLLVFHALGRKRMGEGLVVAAGIVHSARPLWSGSMLTFHHAAAPRARIRQQDSVAPPLAGSNLAKRERPHYNGWL